MKNKIPSADELLAQYTSYEKNLGRGRKCQIILKY